MRMAKRSGLSKVPRVDVHHGVFDSWQGGMPPSCGGHYTTWLYRGGIIALELQSYQEYKGNIPSQKLSVHEYEEIDQNISANSGKNSFFPGEPSYTPLSHF